MSDYIEPTQERFNAAETVIQDVLGTGCPSVISKVGSVVRELVVRPLSYLYSWIATNTDNYRRESSVAYLKTSSATDNEIADMVASNYFVTRRQGTHARGMVSIVVSAPFVRLPLGGRMLVSDVPVIFPEQYILTTGLPSETVAGIKYIVVSPWTPLVDDGVVTSQWIGYVPVEAESYGELEVSPGAPVTVQFPNPFVQQIELISALSGGSGTETDAEMMARCEYSTASSGIGSYYGLRKKLDKAPLDVPGLAVVAGEDDYMYRGRYNAVNINPGGFVDCYIKTRNQDNRNEFSSVDGDITFTRDDATSNPDDGLDLETNSYVYHISIPAVTCPGFYAVLGVRYTDTGGSSTPYRYTVKFAGDRLSGNQTATVTFRSQSSEITSVYVTLAYMDGIAEIQDYMNKEDNTFIGQDVMVKAAVPVPLTMDCAAAYTADLTETQLDLLRRTIANYINNKPVGSAAINFSDIRKICAQALPEADLRLPCTITGSCYTESGMVDTWFSNTGIFNIADNVNKDCFSYKVCFFSLVPDSIRIEQI